MSKTKIPKTDSIEKLAEFWQTHDSTDFEDQLEEVSEPVFVRDSAIQVRLKKQEVAAVVKLAKAKGVSREELVRSWVLKNIITSNVRRSVSA